MTLPSGCYTAAWLFISCGIYAALSGRMMDLGNNQKAMPFVEIGCPYRAIFK